MEFRQIQYFVCLYNEGSVTRAAKRLNIVQPALSMQITKLEDEIGKPLFIRSPQGMQATAEGRRMFQLFEPLVQGFAQAREKMTRTSGELSGEVRIGAVATVAQGVLIEVIKKFSLLHRKVTVSITDGYGLQLSDMVAGGSIEAAIVNRFRSPPSVVSHAVVDEQILLVTGASHAELPTPFAIQNLERLKLVLPTRQHGLRGLIDSQLDAQNIDVIPAMEIDSIFAIIKMVSELPYATILPKGAIDSHSRDMQLKMHPLAPEFHRQLVCITHPHRALTPQADAFLAILFEDLRLSNEPAGRLAR